MWWSGKAQAWHSIWPKGSLCRVWVRVRVRVRVRVKGKDRDRLRDKGTDKGPHT